MATITASTTSQYLTKLTNQKNSIFADEPLDKGR